MGVSVNNLVVHARHILTPTQSWEHASLHAAAGKIQYVGAQKLEPPARSVPHAGYYLMPGMIDLHVNGAAGADAAEGGRETLEKIGCALAAHGTTGYLPTVITDHEKNLMRSLTTLSENVKGEFKGAIPLGIHLEGPFINPVRRGTHPEDGIQKPSSALFEKYLMASREQLKMLTLAPELEGCLQLIEEARRNIPIVSLGHSDAGYECALKAIERGANLATHVFNAMSPLHHREPGLVGAVLDSPLISAELIADGVHVHPAVVRLLVQCKGANKVVLATDAISATTMPDGSHQIGSIRVTVKDGVCRNEEGKLAGSTLTMDKGLRHLVSWLRNESLAKIVAMVTSQPAQLLGLRDKGRLEKGFDADLVLFNEDLQVVKTWIKGKLVYEASADNS